MSIHGAIETLRREFDEKIRALREDMETMARGGAVTLRQITPKYGSGEQGLKRAERFDVIERRLWDRDEEFVPMAQFDEMADKIRALDELRHVVPLIDRINKRAEAADALAFQCFMSLTNLCTELGLHLKIGENGALEVTGATDRAPEMLALSLEVQRMRRARGPGSGL